jgi:predicted nucleic acid-binding protein
LRIDLRRSLRRIKPEKWTGSLAPRNASGLDFVECAEPFGPPLLLDTCVYLDVMEGRLPVAAKDLIKSRPVRHVSVVLGELSHFFGRLVPSLANAAVLEKLRSAIEFIDPRLLSEPTAGVNLEAGILCGLVFRLGGFQVGQELAALNDATIFLHALEQGQTVLTRNLNDFDRMNQIMPGGKVLFYNPV